MSHEAWMPHVDQPKLHAAIPHAPRLSHVVMLACKAEHATQVTDAHPNVGSLKLTQGSAAAAGQYL